MKTRKESFTAPPMLSTTLATAFFCLSAVVLLLFVSAKTFWDFKMQAAVLSSRQHHIAEDAARAVRAFIDEKFRVLKTAVWLTDLETLPEAEQRVILQSLLGLQPAFRHLILLSSRNQSLCQASRLSMDASRQLAGRLKDLLSGEDRQARRAISPVYIDRGTNEPMVTMAVPVTNVFGDVKGTLIAELNLKAMWDIVDQQKIGETGYMYVTDRAGNLLAFEDTARVLKGENVSHVKAVADFIQNREASSANRATQYRGIRGFTVVGSYTPLETPDWAVVTELPWKEAYRGTLQGLGAAVGITLVLALLAGIFGRFVARRLAAPVINLTDTATRIAAGEIDLQAAVDGPREVARLAEAFNSMTAQLRQSLKDLEQRFADLKQTKEAFRLSEERLRLALEGTSDAIWDWNLQTGEVYFSPRYYTMLGYDPDEFPPAYESWRQLLHPEDVALSETDVQRAIEEHSPFVIEFRFKAKNGDWRWILGRGKVVESDSEGRAVRVAGSHTDITERKEAEEALRREKRFSDTLIDGMPGVFYVFDEQGRFVRWNKRLESTTGYTAEEISHMHPRDFFIGEEKDRLLEKMEEVSIKGEAEAEGEFATKDGRSIPCYFKGLRMFIGGRSHVLGVGLDISERKQAQDQSARLQVLLKSVILQSPIPMTLVLSDGTVELFNESCRTALGVEDEPELQPGVNLFTLEASWKDYDAHGACIPLTESPLALALQGKTTRRREMKVVRKDRTERWVLADAVPVHNDNNEVMAGFLIFPDITERKRAEEALSKYERIVSTSQDLMALINTDYAYEAVNESFLKSLDKNREEVVGSTVAEVLGEKIFRERLQPQLDRTLSGETVHHREIVESPSGGRRIMDVTLFPMMDEKGRIEGVVLNARDVTETRKLEEQLMQAQKIESLGTLAGGVAHEINNPINGIMNYAQLIMDRTEKENPAIELASEIIRETRRIATIVKNLLTFARHEKQSHSPAYLSDIVSSVLSLIQTVMRHDQIDLQVDIPEDLPKLKCRSQQIQQVLMNLMTNARDALNTRYPDYSPQKQLRVSARLIEKEERGYIRTTVEDRGTGIPLEIRDRIFDPFFTTKPKETGTGLGLSISYGIVKEHQGKLIVESEFGRYTRFHMDLPVDNGWTLS